MSLVHVDVPRLRLRAHSEGVTTISSLRSFPAIKGRLIYVGVNYWPSIPRATTTKSLPRNSREKGWKEVIGSLKNPSPTCQRPLAVIPI